MNTLTEKALKIFKTFLVRDCGLDGSEAAEEITMMKRANVDAEALPKELEAKFLTYSRIGSKRRVLRKERKRWFLSWENAVNHASYEV